MEPNHFVSACDAHQPAKTSVQRYNLTHGPGARQIAHRTLAQGAIFPSPRPLYFFSIVKEQNSLLAKNQK
jgi:hypothetical protein